MFRRMDLLLLGIALGLTLFGLAMIASVSVFESYQLTERLVRKGLLDAPNNSYFLWRSSLHVCMGFGVLAVTTIIPYHLWQRNARLLFLLTFLLLIAVFIPGIGNEYGT